MFHISIIIVVVRTRDNILVRKLIKEDEDIIIFILWNYKASDKVKTVT